MADAVHRTVCPFCKARNNCQAHGKDPCWCVDLSFPPALLKLVPLTDQGRACICLACLHAYQSDPAGFLARLPR